MLGGILTRSVQTGPVNHLLMMAYGRYAVMRGVKGKVFCYTSKEELLIGEYSLCRPTYHKTG